MQRIRRRDPEVAREEILAAAQQLLWERPFSALTVGDLMSRTSVGRSTFYLYFASRDELAIALLDRLKSALFAAASPWLEGHDPDPIAAIRGALTGVVAVWQEHGPVLRGVAEAAHESEAVRHAWREGFIDRFVEAVAARLRAQPETIVSGDPQEVARALILMNEAYLLERMGQPAGRPPSNVVAETLSEIWVRTLYGATHR